MPAPAAQLGASFFETFGTALFDPASGTGLGESPAVKQNQRRSPPGQKPAKYQRCFWRRLDGHAGFPQKSLSSCPGIRSCTAAGFCRPFQGSGCAPCARERRFLRRAPIGAMRAAMDPPLEANWMPHIAFARQGASSRRSSSAAQSRRTYRRLNSPGRGRRTRSSTTATQFRSILKTAAASTPVPNAIGWSSSISIIRASTCMGTRLFRLKRISSTRAWPALWPSPESC